ncbi:MAG: helix-turn-helix domain-containing protein [Bacteroidales bacterium]
MVCVRCKLVVQSELEKHNFNDVILKEEEIDFSDTMSTDRLNKLKVLLNELGFELVDDNEHVLVEKIKKSISDLVYNSGDLLKSNFSDYISTKLGYSYHYLSNLFSSIHGNSIEKYYIRQKIDRVKEIIINEDLSLSEVAFKVHYSSTSHLSAQFKKETGLTLTQFKKVHCNRK